MGCCCITGSSCRKLLRLNTKNRQLIILSLTPNPFFMEFQLIDHDYIQLNQLLKLLGLVDTGGEANQRIVDGEVIVNKEVEYQKRKKLRPGDSVLFNKVTIVVK